MDLRPVTEPRVEGRVERKGKTLTVTDSRGAVIVQGAVDKAEASFKTAEGRWRIEAADRGVAVVDWAGKVVATARKGEVVLPSGERFLWKRSSLPRVRYRLGDDLWVARGSWRARRFSAELSPAMVGREDKSLLVGIASILTQDAIERRGRLLGTAGGFGASWG
jgi:hypothetical protein